MCVSEASFQIQQVSNFCWCLPNTNVVPFLSALGPSDLRSVDVSWVIHGFYSWVVANDAESLLTQHW